MNKKDPIKGKKIFTRKDEDVQLKHQLLLAPELLLTNRGDDENLEKLSVKIRLQNDEEVSIEEYLLPEDQIAAYYPKFPKEFFHQIAKLKDIPVELMEPYHKPICVPKFINEFIYGRFPYKLLKQLRKKNTYIAQNVWLRPYKHFQLLSNSTSEMLDVIIEEALEVMKECPTMSDFKKAYSAKYKVYAQLDVFEDREI